MDSTVTAVRSGATGVPVGGPADRGTGQDALGPGLRRTAPSRTEFLLANPLGGRPPKHGGKFVFGDPATWGAPHAQTTTPGTAITWDRLRPRLTRGSTWEHLPGRLPVISGTVIRLQVEHLPTGGAQAIWLWWSGTDATEHDVDRLWIAFLGRFGLEHDFRLLNQTLGWNSPRLRSSAAADRWTWLILPPTPTAPGTQARPRSAAALGTPAATLPTHPRPRSPRVSAPAQGDRIPRPLASRWTVGPVPVPVDEGHGAGGDRQRAAIGVVSCVVRAVRLRGRGTQSASRRSGSVASDSQKST
ncbi:hypothetical protein [Actinomadura sp. 21ATH]|uniref:hypothetical protein n=1 Tax=Actinomadura sp. 21ATH TaxID=1735444 RepID=UPI0035BF85CD